MHSPKKNRWISAAVGGFCFVLLSGCLLGPHVRRADRTTSIVEFLYPGKNNPLAEATIPVLRLPLRVGVAFVPKASPAGKGIAYASGGHVSELEKSVLLQRVTQAFAGRDYIASLQTIPETYLQPKGGFENLDQIRRIMNIDVIALVSYDQIQFTDQNRLSLAYWTIVGAYVVKGNKNDTQTLMEATVYDVASRQMLFRAPGVGHVEANSTFHQLSQNLRQDSTLSLEMATAGMIEQLKAQLEEFRVRVKEAPGTVAKVEHRPGYSGAGDTGAAFTLGFLMLISLVGYRGRKAGE